MVKAYTLKNMRPIWTCRKATRLEGVAIIITMEIEKNKIVLTAEAELKDNEFREVAWQEFKRIDTRLTNVNERSKGHTVSIKDIEKRLKELEDGD